MERKKKAPRHLGPQLKAVIRRQPTVFAVYTVLRLIVLATLVSSIIRGEYESAFICLLVLGLFVLPFFIQQNFGIELPSTLEIIILLFIFASEILGELKCYFITYPHWDSMLHTTTGFLCAATGFALIDILNRNSKIKFQLSPIYVAVAAFCFSMTVGVLWEFFEFGMDRLFMMDMQKDTVVNAITSVMLDPTNSNIPVTIDGITSGGDASEYVVKPLMQDAFGGTMDELYDRALHRTVYNSVAVPCGDLQSTAEKLVNGFTVVLFGQRAIAFETKTGEKRSPSAPEVENTVKGPKDAFTETVRTNTGLLRRHLRTPALRLYETVVGRRSLTNVTLVWIDGLTDPALVSRMQARLAEIDIDGLLTPAAVEEYLTGSRATAFPLLQYTERTDRFAQALLEGRAGLLVDGLPLGYLAPVDLGYLMTSAEDRGTDFVSASFLRVLRYAALLLGLLLPGLYVAMAAFHPQMLPTELLQSILESKRAVPFPTIVEVLGLLAAFELLQEASVSLPQSVGQSLSIIGGLVVGSAAVEARLISPAALIVVAAAGICGFAIPGRSFADALRVWRMALAAAASLAGLFGLTLGAICLVVHLAGLDSFGISYLAPFSGVGGARALLRPRLVREPLRDPLLRPLDRRNQGEKR